MQRILCWFHAEIVSAQISSQKKWRRKAANSVACLFKYTKAVKCIKNIALKRWNRCHMRHEMVNFCCVWHIRRLKLKNIWKKYWKIFENLLTKCEWGAILCTEKGESETQIWLFFRQLLKIKAIYQRGSTAMEQRTGAVAEFGRYGPPLFSGVHTACRMLGRVWGNGT